MKRFFSNINNCTKNKRGFTLIELLVVIVIIATLATLLTSNFIGIRQRGRDAQRKSDLRQVQSALELYRSDNGSYPKTADYPNCGSALQSGTTVYMKRIPCDPSNNTVKYTYVATPGCDNVTTYCIAYVLYSCLENIKDSDSDANQGRTPPLTFGCTIASYTVTNP